ncbi:MAG: DUF2339 domain-containing protein [Bacteroidia bacterium]
MSTPTLEEISAKLNELIRQHNQAHQEILALRKELLQLKDEKAPEKVVSSDKKVSEPPVLTTTPSERVKPPVVKTSPPPREKTIKPDRNLEAFIGGNLISKIGIAILVIGVGFFVKFAIDNDLVSPVIRVIGGFLAGFSLVGLAYVLKENYKSYSAILLGGGIAILYFTTFAAFDFYHLIPKGVAFGLMLVFTAFGVLAAYWYNIQAIAIIGLAGAYAVPILLSDNTGEIRNLFIYISIVNVGILALAFRKYWHTLNYIAFALTWGVYLAWMEDRYVADRYFQVSLTFAAVFFLLFYGALLAYKLIHLEKYNWRDIVFLLLNSSIFYGTGYGLIEGIENGDRWLGLFTLANALVHFVVTLLIYNRKLADRNLFYLVAGLVLTFLTLAVPVQLEGNWVTMLWICEAVIVFWVGRTQKVFFYEALAYILAGMSFFSLLQDWGEGYSNSVYLLDEKVFTPIFNIHFLTSFLVIAGFAAMTYFHTRYKPEETQWRSLQRFGGVLLPSLLLITAFAAFLPEIDQFFTQLMASTKIVLDGADNFNYDLNTFSALWSINYAFLFMAALLAVNMRFWNNKAIYIAGIVASGIGVLLFLTESLPDLYQLRENYFHPGENPIFKPGMAYLYMRYICYAFLGINLWMNYRAHQTFDDPRVKTGFGLAFHLIMLALLSAELQHIIHVMYPEADTYLLERKVRRVGFSVLWGLYALVLMILGFWKKLQYLRIASIALFGVILVKVFIFDLDKTTLGNKTVIFLALGVLLMIISFLYQRFKSVILGDEPEQQETKQETDDENV